MMVRRDNGSRAGGIAKNPPPSADVPPVVTLYRASVMLGMQGKVRRNWTPLLESLCEQGGIDVRPDEDGVPCCRSDDVPKLGRLVERYRSRKYMWRRDRPSRGATGLSSL